ncbi:MAG: hypothetical protein GY910_05305 [bacterium]|nr:hypothetical protein [Deltaproteobacteria bacterium]MCP4904380.1 hypothetical protein [bacterium]
MGEGRHTEEAIIGKLRTAEIGLAKGLATAEVVHKLEIAEQSYYRGRKEYGAFGTTRRAADRSFKLRFPHHR